MYWGHYNKWRARIQNATPDLRSKLKHAYATAVQATTYFDRLEVDDKGQPLGGDVYMALTQERAKDMRTFTAALSLLSSPTLAPVLRLEPKLNSLRGDLNTLGHCVRTAVPRNHFWKTSRLTRQLGERMRSLIAEEFLARIDAPESGDQIEGIKLVTDLPLELLPTQGLPLGLRFDTSRVTPVPGNLFLQQCMLPQTILPKDAFKEILVLRSFKPSDPLRTILETAVRHMDETQPGVASRCTFVDVGSEDDIIAALRAFNGAMLVFDCHGTYDRSTGMGTLVIGGSPLDPWALRRRCEVPPIVMFSACDTQPLDGSHSSVATAAFVLGARAVLATTLPIQGDKAAVLLARLLLRLDMYIPIALKIRPLLTWREIVSGMLRMTHASEVIRQLQQTGRIRLDDEDRKAVQLLANTAINARAAQWYDAFLEELANRSCMSVEFLRSEVARWAGLTDAMKYVQLGNPESIVIFDQMTCPLPAVPP